jgi:catechol 2,3-dioxygenase-like lactoylglutathione lyase family enzyme
MKRSPVVAEALCAFLAAAALAQAQTVTGVGNFIHNVADLDQSLAFYHDVLGMEVQRAPGAQPAGPRPFVATPEILDLYHAPHAQFRVATALVPESPMRAELVEFKDIDRKPVRPRIQDPGASIFILTVRDLAPVIMRIHAQHASVVTAGGNPVLLADGSRAMLVQDPDGFFVELVQRNPEPTSKAPADSNFIGVSFAFTISDAVRMARVFKDALGFDPQTGNFIKDAAQGKLLGTGAQTRRTAALVPGTSCQVEFLEFKGIGGKPVRSRLQDPGSGVLRLLVRDADAAVKQLDAAGVKVASAGGQIVKLPGNNANLRAAIVSAPDNLFVQVLQNGPAK